MCIDAVLAGAIIGKAGANVKQISRLTGMHLSQKIEWTHMNSYSKFGDMSQYYLTSHILTSQRRGRRLVPIASTTEIS